MVDQHPTTSRRCWLRPVRQTSLMRFHNSLRVSDSNTNENVANAISDLTGQPAEISLQHLSRRRGHEEGQPSLCKGIPDFAQVGRLDTCIPQHSKTHASSSSRLIRRVNWKIRNRSILLGRRSPMERMPNVVLYLQANHRMKEV